MPFVTDGSKPVIYIRERAKAKWIVYFEGTGSAIGEMCGNRQNCTTWLENASWASGPTASPESFPEAIQASGVLSGNACENPAYYDYSVVYVPLCTADAYIGDIKEDPLILLGEQLFKGVLTNIAGKGIEELVVAGSGAGAVGMLLHAEWISSIDVNAKSMIFDSFWDLTDTVDYTSEELATFYNLDEDHACATPWGRSARCMLPLVLLHGNVRICTQVWNDECTEHYSFRRESADDETNKCRRVHGEANSDEDANGCCKYSQCVPKCTNCHS